MRSTPRYCCHAPEAAARIGRTSIDLSVRRVAEAIRIAKAGGLYSIPDMRSLVLGTYYQAAD